mmetsp:Transcript_99082/g.190190  ORF Transcript_99082/g.190190 Transcript_99082/m.190190 type:complete len:248 (+) Transcript_99082:1343-2086(+)
MMGGCMQMGGMGMGGMGGPPPPPMAAFGSPPAAGSGGGRFGGGGGMGGMGGFGRGGGFGFGGGPQSKPDGPEEPTAILRSSRGLALGPSDVNESTDLSRATRALKYSIGQVNATPANQNTLPEDPLVSQLLGTSPPAQGAVHAGFTCDHCKMLPIVGPRFKATNKADIDLCLGCRTSGHFAGGNGFVLIADQETAIRFGLQAVLEWWPLVFQEHAQLFQQTLQQGLPQLSTLSLSQLKQAVARLPDM